MREGVDENEIRRDKFEVVFSQVFSLHFRKLWGENIESIKALELRIKDGLG